MYELIIYTRFAILRDVGNSLVVLISEGESYSYALEFVVYSEGVEVYRHINQGEDG